MSGVSRFWTCSALLEPFGWPEPATVWVRPDLFEPERPEMTRDDVFAAMALCPHHRFVLKTNYRHLYHCYVEKIARDRMEHSTWLMSVSFILSELGLHHLGRGDGPRWPLTNVQLLESLPNVAPSGVGEG